MKLPCLVERSLLAVVLSLSATAGGCSKNGAASSMLAVGSPAPPLSAVDQDGKVHSLADYRGQPTVVYFYPKDDSPGCTKEACAFRDVWEQYEQANVVVLGLSTDDRASKEAFSKKHLLPFPVLADPDAKWVEAFGVPTKFGLASRVTFLLGSDGKVAKVYPDVDPGVHARKVLEDAKQLPR